MVFDNSDGRLAVDSDEVVLRRTIGLKKDEFFVQRKRATKKEIASLLEGAGFSKGNPYYIVQQGKVNALCTMSSADRLELLKEVAGCTVYDEKRADSLKQMEENGHSRYVCALFGIFVHGRFLPQSQGLMKHISASFCVFCFYLVCMIEPKSTKS